MGFSPGDCLWLRASCRYASSLYGWTGPKSNLNWEGPWKVKAEETVYNQLSLTFIDPSIGGSGLFATGSLGSTTWWPSGY